MRHKIGTARADATTPPIQIQGAAVIAAPSKTSLQFVNLTDTAVLGASARKFVRSHVMKDYETRTAARISGVESELPLRTSSPMKDVNKGIYTWNSAIPDGSTGGGTPDTNEEPRLAESATSSVERESQGSAQSLQDFHFESNNETEDIWESFRGTELQPFNQPEIWSPGDADWSTSQTRYGTSNGGEAGEETRLESLPSPPIYNFEIANSRFDPFETLPFSTPKSEILLQHFLSRITVSTLVMSARKHWFLLSLTDKAFFLIALSHAAAHRSRPEQKGAWNPSEALQLRTEAIRVINERVRNVGEYGPTDGTIGAVASILTYEATNGNPFAIRAHLTGLSQMISMRGGIVAAGFSNVLLRLILRADLSSANVLGTQPLFPPLSECDLIIPSTGPSFPLLNQDIDFQASNTVPSMLLPPPLTTAFRELRYLIKILDVSEIPGALLGLYSSDTLWFSDRVYVVQRTLMNLAAEYASLASHAYQDPAPGSTWVAAPASIASLVFIECFLRDTAPNARIISILLSRLVLAIQRAHVTEVAIHRLSLASSSPEHTVAEDLARLAAWIFAVGGIAASENGNSPGQRGWWVERLKSTLGALSGRGGAGVEQALKSVVWPEEATGTGSSHWMIRLQDLLGCCDT